MAGKDAEINKYKRLQHFWNIVWQCLLKFKTHNLIFGNLLHGNKSITSIEGCLSIACIMKSQEQLECPSVGE